MILCHFRSADKQFYDASLLRITNRDKCCVFVGTTPTNKQPLASSAVNYVMAFNRETLQSLTVDWNFKTVVVSLGEHRIAIRVWKRSPGNSMAALARE